MYDSYTNKKGNISRSIFLNDLIIPFTLLILFFFLFLFLFFLFLLVRKVNDAQIKTGNIHLKLYIYFIYFKEKGERIYIII